jgi:hypothetical protein
MAIVSDQRASLRPSGFHRLDGRLFTAHHPAGSSMKGRRASLGGRESNFASCVIETD